MKKTLHPYNYAKFIFHTNGSAFLQGIPITKNSKKIGSLPMAFRNPSYPPHGTGTFTDNFYLGVNIGHIKNKINKFFFSPKLPSPTVNGQKAKKYKKKFILFLNTDIYVHELWLRKKKITDQNIETPLSKFKQKYKI